VGYGVVAVAVGRGCPGTGPGSGPLWRDAIRIW